MAPEVAAVTQTINEYTYGSALGVHGDASPAGKLAEVIKANRAQVFLYRSQPQLIVGTSLVMLAPAVAREVVSSSCYPRPLAQLKLRGEK